MRDENDGFGASNADVVAQFEAMQKAKDADNLQHWRWTIAKDVLAALNTTPRPMSNDQMIGKAVEQADLLIAALKKGR